MAVWTDDGGFDNRNPLYAAYMQLRGRKGYPHFKIELAGKKIVYCYIRKNACTTFKTLLITETDPTQADLHSDKRYGFMARHCQATFPKDIRDADHTIFIYRDPFERIVSLFLNKFVQQSGAEDILSGYQRVTGRDPQDASFSDFLHIYLTENLRSRDVHVLPQRRHLLPIRYTDAIPMHDLNRRMEAILGAEIAGRYFKKRVNDTQTGEAQIEVDAITQPASALRTRFLETGAMPSKESFLTPDAKARITALYQQDMVFASEQG